MTILSSRALGVASLALLSGLAAAQTFTVSAGFAPNFFGARPSYDAFAQNFILGIDNNTSTVGDQTGPTGYQNVIGGTFDARRNIATDFRAFNGVADFGGPAFANERGNRLTFGLNITSPGVTNTFTLAQLEDGTESSIADDQGFDVPLESYAGFNFSPTRIGRFYGADGVRGGSDDLVYNSDVAGAPDDTLPINEISLISIGIAEDALSADAGATNQDRIDSNAIQYGDYTLTGAFRLNGGAIQRGTVNFQAVPEPATMAALGFGALALLRRRKASK